MKQSISLTFGILLFVHPAIADIKLPRNMTNDAVPRASIVAEDDELNDNIARPLPLPRFPQTAKAGFELPPVLSASKLLPAEVLVGTVHRVREQVPTDGFVAWFTVDSEYGTFQCAGIESVTGCVQEIAAIRKLAEVSRSDIFAEGLKRSIEQPIDAVKNVVTKPVETVKAVPKTVGHFFNKVGKAIKTTTAKVKENIEGESEIQPDEAMHGIGNTAKSIIGFDSAKLECAKQLGVDPYTDNQRLREEIDKISWVFFAGGLPLKIGASAATAGGATAITAVNYTGLPDEVYKLTPNELNLRSQETLASLKVPEELRVRFVNNPALSVSVKQSIVNSLVVLGKSAGIPRVVELAADCQTRKQAAFLDRSLRVLAKQQKSGASAYQEILIIGRLLGGQDASGKLQVPAPVDYISWTEEVAQFALREDLTALKPDLLLTGTMSEKALTEVTAAGWKIKKP